MVDATLRKECSAVSQTALLDWKYRNGGCLGFGLVQKTQDEWTQIHKRKAVCIVSGLGD